MLSSAAILVVYAAGFMKTRAAAAQLDEASNERRPSMPAPATAGETQTPERIEPPASVAAPVATAAAATAPLTSPVMPKAEAKKAEPAPIAETLTTTAAPNATDFTNPTNQKESPEQNPTHVPNSTNPSNPVPEAAKAAEEKSAPALLMPKEKYNDGTYVGWGHCRHGDIQASVTVENGRFVSASIAQCWTRYSCSWVAHLPPQVVARQSPNVDYVSGATESANAFYWAVVDALTKAKGPQVRQHDPK